MSKRLGLRIPWAIPYLNSCRRKGEDAPPGRRQSYDGAASATVDFPPAYLWREEEKWHVIAREESAHRQKIDSGNGGKELFPPLRLPHSRRRRATAKKKIQARSRISTSSADSRWFSSEDERQYVEEYGYKDGETEVPMSSSWSFSTDESSPPAERAPPATHVLQRLKTESLLKLPEGKVKESFAVVKKSEDPYGDFQSSMAEMIIENEMYEEEELEQLLHCFLVLNSRHHHPAIVRAFTDIWAALFPST